MRLLFSTAIILLLDQGTKYFFLHQSDLPWWLIDQRVGLDLVMNPGIAFSLPISGIASIVLSLVMLLFLIFLFKQYTKAGLWRDLVFGCVFGGAFGNLLDRFLFGSVVDFIKIYSYPTFNIADIAITVGVVLMIVGYKKIFLS